MEADRGHSGEGKGKGGTHTTGNHRGGGGIPWGGGGRGGLAALHHIIYIYIYVLLLQSSGRYTIYKNREPQEAPITLHVNRGLHKGEPVSEQEA